MIPRREGGGKWLKCTIYTPGIFRVGAFLFFQGLPLVERKCPLSANPWFQLGFSVLMARYPNHHINGLTSLVFLMPEDYAFWKAPDEASSSLKSRFAMVTIGQLFVLGLSSLSDALLIVLPCSASCSHLTRRGFSLYIFLIDTRIASNLEMVLWLRLQPWSFPRARPTSPCIILSFSIDIRIAIAEICGCLKTILRNKLW